MPAYRKVHACYKVCSAGQTFSSMPELGSVPAFRRRARGLRPALRTESRPSGFDP
ncbi:hypothetical protein C8E08_2834 [Paracidovorax citrulli]|nr:hypothetical protein C8E08_2834 [Paracidovorax citrulli]REG70350.1 hypothetical protein C8E07_3546 [Paracidovorax citrulli]RLJ94902.1 hypothetical protein C8E06_3541 [Paracidovorax citrulli]